MFIESNIVFLIAAILIPIVYFFGIFPRRIEILKKQDELVIKKINSFFSKEEKKLLCNSDTKLVGGQTGVKGYYFPILIYKDGNSNKKIRLHHGIFSFPSGDVVGDLTRFVKKEEIERIAKFLDLRLKLE